MKKSIFKKCTQLIEVKILSLIIVLFCVCTVQAQDLKIHVNKKGKVGFVDVNGNEAVKCIYESAFPFKNGVAIVCKSGRYGIIDQTGKIILPLKYSQITPWNDKLYLIKSGKTMGLANLKGEIVLEAKYSLISKSNCYGKALIAIGGKTTSNEKQSYQSNAKYGIIDNYGKILIEPLYKGLYEFAYEGNKEVLYHEGKRLLYSYHYNTDTLKTDCKYLGVSKNGFNIKGCGLINEKGNELIKEGVYDYIMYPSSDMVRYYMAKKKETICGYHDLNTNKNITSATFDMPISEIKFWTHGDFIGEIAPINGESWSFIDKKGNILRTGYQSLKHSEVSALWAAQKSSGKWDVFNDKNDNVSALSEYENIDFPTFSEDKEIFTVKKDNLFGCVDRNGNIIIPFEYDQMLSNTYDMVPIMKNNKWGAITPDNQEIVPLEFINLLLPSERNTDDIWVMKSDSLYYHYKVSEKRLFPTGYKAVDNFKEGIAHVQPADMPLYDSVINRSQLFHPNSDQKTIESAKIEDYKEIFGYLLRNDGTLLIDIPISTIYKGAILRELDLLGNKTLSKKDKKQILLKVTETNRSYDLKSVLEEDEWNF